MLLPGSAARPNHRLSLTRIYTLRVMNTDENHNEELINTVIMDDEENTYSEDLTQLFEMEGNVMRRRKTDRDL